MRLLNRPLALACAAALAVAVIILIIEVTGYSVHAAPVIVPWKTWYRRAAGTHWNQLVIQVWSAILILIGLLVRAVEPKPHSPAANLHALHQRIEGEGLSHARQALGRDSLPIKVDLDASRRNG